MFYSLTGKIIMQDAVSVAIDCGGVGFRCFTTMNTLKKIGSVGGTATLFTHLSVREDAMDLYGFHSNEELTCFRELLSVSGVGPKAALAVLSALSPEKLALAIATGDAKTITQAQGVGPKLAQRMVLELKDKLSAGLSPTMDLSAGIASAAGNAGEAVSALVMLGYSQSEASVAVARIDSALPVEELIKQALKNLAKF
ncbi:MAG: Holliday junction branch migration protein RuvA [Oscillospiraceae bacterium]|jgi:Holliday junction DNA helicase RuvA|nr:Holliday junction branch migration protein RuvA [Oscillospiraceae bacterium]